MGRVIVTAMSAIGLIGLGAVLVPTPTRSAPEETTRQENCMSAKEPDLPHSSAEKGDNSR